MIAVAGTIVVDVLAHPVAGMPERGDLEAVERIDLYVGGAVANTGMALSRVGVPVGAVGCVARSSVLPRFGRHWFLHIAILCSQYNLLGPSGVTRCSLLGHVDSLQRLRLQALGCSPTLVKFSQGVACLAPPGRKVVGNTMRHTLLSHTARVSKSVFESGVLGPV